MNMVPKSAYYEERFARNSKAFSGAYFVYTEEAGGSSPSSPTTQLIDFIAFTQMFTNRSGGSLNLSRLAKGASR